MAYRKRGDRSKILLNSVDVLILDILDKNRDEITMLSLSKILKLNSLSERTHINRLVNHKFIIKKRVIGQNKFILNITELGEEVLKIFGKAI
jgi:hypothetical protein